MTIGSRLYKNGKITGRLEFQTTGKKVHLNSKEWREFKARMNTTIFERGGRPYGERWIVPQNIDRLLRALWIKACRYDGIDLKAMFVVFSNENPHYAQYDKIMGLKLKGDCCG